MVGYNLRFTSSLQEFAGVLAGGRIGRPLTVRAEVGQNLAAWRPHMDYRSTVSAQKSLGGGVLLELSHEIDYLTWLFGQATKVSSTVAKASGMDIDVEDMAHILIEWSGADTEPTYGTLVMDFFRHDPLRYCHVVAEKGSLRWDCLENTVTLYCAQKKRWETIYNGQEEVSDSYKAELIHFVECIAKADRPIVTGQDGRRVLQFIDAVRRSAKMNSEIIVS